MSGTSSFGDHILDLPMVGRNLMVGRKGIVVAAQFRDDGTVPLSRAAIRISKRFGHLGSAIMKAKLGSLPRDVRVYAGQAN